MKLIRVQAFILALALCFTGLLLPASADEGLIVLMDENFDDYEAGVEGSATKLADKFVTDANSIGDGYVRIEEDSTGNLYLMSHVFTQVYLREPVKGAYVFSASSSEMQGAHQAGLFIRAPQGAAAYYEGDGGDPDRGTSCGMSGLWIYGYQNTIEVNVKAFNSKMPNKLIDNTVSFPMPEGSSCSGETYCTFRFEDNGESVAMYADDVLFCTAVFSVGESTTKARAAGVSVKCFKTVTLLDADGGEVLSVTDTLVSMEESIVGWATRVANMKVDNVLLESVPVGGDTEPPTEAPTEAPFEPVEPSEADRLDAAFPVVHKNRVYPWLGTASETFTFDFTDTDLTFYSKNPALSTASLRTGMAFDGSVLACVTGKTFSFGSGVFLGDDYGLTGGTASFKLDLLGGSLSVGTRLEKAAADTTRKGLWFRITGDSVTVTEPLSGFKAVVGLVPPKGPGIYTLVDDVDNVTLKLDGKDVVSVQYLNVHGDLLVRDADGKPIAYAQNTGLNPAGYITLWADNLEGYIDDFSFEHVTVTDTTVLSGDHALDYSTWVATDDRSRTTPTVDGTTVRSDKQVGLFYFVSHGGGNTSEMPLDITTLYNKLGQEAFIEYLSDETVNGGFDWAEPYFGYYQAIDKWVLRKHAMMLEAAGVDFIFVDNTNGATYNEAELALFDTWLEMRKEGLDTPQICVFGGSSSEAVLGNVRGTIYSDENWDKYYELFYLYEGKPLYLGDENTFGVHLEWAKEHFTIRNCWAWQDADNTWSWLQEYKISPDGTKVQYVNGGPGRDANGRFEALALCVGHHPTTNKGRSYVNTVFPEVNNDFGFSLDSGAGTGFAGQWEAIKILDPTVMLITGWNEWGAGLNHGKESDTFAGMRLKTPFYMVDAFNTEYSRDAEPMRLRQGELQGFGDNYYYQMVSIIREFKGMDAVAKAEGQQTVDIRKAEDWANVGPVYTDSVGDTSYRHSDGASVYTVYVNNTGRNDFDTAKVSQDRDYLYFTVSCVNDIVRDDTAGASNWMNLFINLDGDPATGWEGFDFVINRAHDAHYVSIESLSNGWDGVPVGQALYTVNGKVMTIRVSKAALGVSGEQSGFLFKWADNSTWTGAVMEFMDLGDTAPNDRFAYKYVGGMGETREVVYTLDGEELRDECKPLPAQSASGADTEPGTAPSGEPTQPSDGSDTTGTSSGCKSMAAGIVPVLLLLAGVMLVKKKERV